MGPVWGRQDPGGPHVGPMNFAIWDAFKSIPAAPLTMVTIACVWRGLLRILVAIPKHHLRWSASDVGFAYAKLLQHP